MLLSVVSSIAQIKNSKIETVAISGNCGMCKSTIEKAGTVKNTAKVVWNETTKTAVLTYDSKKTNQDEILKRIALSGYDSEKFLAPDAVYNNLHGCCQYERTAKPAAISNNVVMPEDSEKTISKVANQDQNFVSDSNQSKNLKSVFEAYFAVKESLIKSDGKLTATQATELLSEINNVKPENLSAKVQTIWNKVNAGLKEETSHIAGTKDLKHQRDRFVSLSKIVYELIKIDTKGTTVYYQFCPMANNGKGANWLSKESEIRNPYYGSQMLGCGKTVETIK